MQSISPGVTDTSIFETAGIQEVLNDAKDRGKVLDPSDIADAVVYTLSTPAHVQVSSVCVKDSFMFTDNFFVLDS